MILKLKRWHVYVSLFIIGVVLISLIRGCSQSRLQVTKYNKIDSLNKELIKFISQEKTNSDSTTKAYQDSLEFITGQYALAKEQALRTGGELQQLAIENKALTEKHKLAQYTDTATIVVPSEYVIDCENCYTRLEQTTNVSLKYKDDLNKLQGNWEKQNQINQKRFKELDAEKLGFYNKIKSLTKQQQDAIDKSKPHGRLYLSWGVLWKPWPWGAGAGLLYQTKYNVMYGAKWYYGSAGQIIETTISFPLSIKF